MKLFSALLHRSEPSFCKVEKVILPGSQNFPTIVVLGFRWKSCRGDFVTQQTTIGGFKTPLRPDQFIGSGTDTNGVQFSERTDLITTYVRRQAEIDGVKPYGEKIFSK